MIRPMPRIGSRSRAFLSRLVRVPRAGFYRRVHVITAQSEARSLEHSQRGLDSLAERIDAVERAQRELSEHIGRIEHASVVAAERLDRIGSDLQTGEQRLAQEVFALNMAHEDEVVAARSAVRFAAALEQRVHQVERSAVGTVDAVR